MNKNVLIASSTLDEPTYGPVAAHLSERGCEVLVFEADKVAEGTKSLSIKIDNESGTTIHYNNTQLVLASLGAAWYRRARHFYNTGDTKHLAIDSERAALQDGVWNLIPDNTWLNAPRIIPSASKKLTQLDTANKLGFRIPNTIVSNQWESILNELPKDIIYKSSSPMFYDDGTVMTMFTTPFQNTRNTLPSDRNPYPGIWQERLPKSREWRITAVGEETFDAAVYTDEHSKDDWRKRQLIPGAVEFRREPFPDEHKEKCIQYLGAMGLRFGAFDFVEDHDGQIIFLECNPNGQFKWLEDTLDMPITNAIADELIKIMD